MFKKHLAIMTIIALAAVSIFAVCAKCQENGKMASNTSAPVKVNNTICPVTGDKVNMKNPVTVEYKGKIYNLCCPMCVEPFKADPEKYIAKIAERENKK